MFLWRITLWKRGYSVRYVIKMFARNRGPRQRHHSKPWREKEMSNPVPRANIMTNTTFRLFIVVNISTNHGEIESHLEMWWLRLYLNRYQLVITAIRERYLLLDSFRGTHFVTLLPALFNYETTWLMTRTFYKLLYYIIVLYFNSKVMTKVNESHLKSNRYHLKQTIQKQKGISTILKCGIIYQTTHTQWWEIGRII